MSLPNCPKSEPSLIPDSLARMLQQHQAHHQQQQQHQFLGQSQQQESHHKAFVCEICGKAFRFRSNLAEHRSVHTAVKPFVCKFCGKSSRLKGNLTKHILKHHKTEQRDYIGTDEYIIKKGKKSVKDPAAIEFLERSMIVLNNSSSSGAAQSQAGEEQNDEVEGPPGILLSLGLDGASLDLKTESNSDAADDAFDDFAPGTGNHNERLLEHCESAFDGVVDGSEGTGHEEADYSGNAGNGSGQQSPQQVGIDDTAGVQSGEEMLRLLTALGQPNHGQGEHLESPQTDAMPTGGSFRLATQCQQCGKHFRKPRDLIAHLSSAHNALPSQNAAASPSSQQATSSDDIGLCGRVKRVSGSSRGEGDDIAQELRQLRTVVLELKTGGVPSAARLEQMLGQLDSRVCRLEKQLEMALNSIYTLVQLQTGINNSVSKLSRSLLNNQ